MLISDAEKLDIENAITDAENKTSGEIVTVIIRASAGYYYIPYMWAALSALIVPWPLIHWTWTPVQDIFLIQLAVFAALALILHYPSLRYALVPRSVMRSRAHQFAMQQFFAQDIYTTAGHTGVCCLSLSPSAIRKSLSIPQSMPRSPIRNGKASSPN